MAKPFVCLDCNSGSECTAFCALSQKPTAFLSTQPVTDSVPIHSARNRQRSYPLSQSPTAFLSTQPVTDSVPIHSASRRQRSYPLSQSPTAFLSTQPVTYPLSQSRVYSASHLSSQLVTEYTAFYPLSQSLNIQRSIHSASH